jgi:hypothetical protein
METINIEKLRCERDELRETIKGLNAALKNALASGESVENLCGTINKLTRELEILDKKIRVCEPNQDSSSSEQDRKAIAIIGGGRGVDIRAKNDDTTKYTTRKRLSYDEIIKNRAAPKSNGKSTTQPSVAKV